MFDENSAGAILFSLNENSRRIEYDYCIILHLIGSFPRETSSSVKTDLRLHVEKYMRRQESVT